jgi:hypothetical protein
MTWRLREIELLALGLENVQKIRRTTIVSLGGDLG